MRKTLLLIAAFVLTLSLSARSINTVLFDKAPNISKIQESNVDRPWNVSGDSFIEFSYAQGSPANTYGLNNVSSGSYIIVAFSIPVELQALYIGSEITAVNFYSATNGSKNPFTSVLAFASEDISSPLKEMEYTMGKITDSPVAPVTIELNNPLKITGEKPIYVGYAFKYSSSGYYVTTDEIINNNPSCLIGIAKSMSVVPTYENYADQIGSVCMGCTIVGDNLPENLITPTSLSVADYIAVDSDFGYVLTVKNMGSNEIDNVIVNTQFGDVNSDKEISLSSPIQPGQISMINIDGFNCDKIGSKILKSSILQVNGVAVENPVTLETTFNCINTVYPRRAVIEEFTGTWCGWCPAGIVMMETIKKKYPEWIRIAVHYQDPMQIASYNSVINTYVSGFPFAMVNRTLGYTPTAIDASTYDEIADFVANNTYCDIDFDVEFNEANVSVNSTTTFGMDTTDPHTLAFAIVQDDMGPFDQVNYYAGGSNGVMDGWEKEAGEVSTVFDDVARVYTTYSNAYPSQITEGSYNFSTTLPLAAVSNLKYRVIGFVINNKTGEIITGYQVYNPASVAKTDFDGNKITINVVGNEILVKGASDVQVYNLSGISVGTKDLQRGLYIVKADGLTQKVMVK